MSICNVELSQHYASIKNVLSKCEAYNFVTNRRKYAILLHILLQTERNVQYCYTYIVTDRNMQYCYTFCFKQTEMCNIVTHFVTNRQKCAILLHILLQTCQESIYYFEWYIPVKSSANPFSVPFSIPFSIPVRLLNNTLFDQKRCDLVVHTSSNSKWKAKRILHMLMA